MLSLAMLAGVLTPPAWGKSSWPFWSRYAERFITPEGRVVDPDRSSMTTSEGQSYALFFSLVANDPRAFQKILTWTEDNLARGRISSNLPAWSWGKNNDDQWGVLDANSASDSDLWIAYSLIQAGTLWQRPDYAAKGASLLHRIAQEEVVEIPRLGPVLLPGKTGFHTADTWVLNPSYLPLPLLYASGNVDPRGPWKQMARNLPFWLEESSPGGFAMDWVQCNLTNCSPIAGPGNTTGTPRGSYDAIRVYLWAGIAGKDTPGNKRLLKTFSPMLSYMKAHPLPPESVAADSAILSASGPASFAAALIPFAFNSGEYALTGRLRQRVAASISPSTGLLGSPARYYDQNLALFALGWQQRFFRFAPDGTLKVPWKA
ncbi:cellulose synthase complex periplasmic endoglucanase BcsZ [Granulicella sp. WH15]|uniref:cellulose synthase complex periplasmic endoglucanase BcsZ n=1 Tax=Granulicella sp. WH15 TaxID=2602070 RepID=UPI0013A58064|nr:cellulose synthase complex periplasmic endoglucanase BcsZ [Granulicella sp. WH15]